MFPVGQRAEVLGALCPLALHKSCDGAVDVIWKKSWCVTATHNMIELLSIFVHEEIQLVACWKRRDDLQIV